LRSCCWANGSRFVINYETYDSDAVTETIVPLGQLGIVSIVFVEHVLPRSRFGRDSIYIWDRKIESSVRLQVLGFMGGLAVRRMPSLIVLSIIATACVATKGD